MKYIELTTKLITQLDCIHPQVKKIWEYGGLSAIPTNGNPKRTIGVMFNDGSCQYFEDDGNGDAIEKAEEYLQSLPQQNDVKGGELATFKNNDVREDDVDKLATEWIQNKLNIVKPTEFCSIDTIKEWVEQAKQMELKAKENTYTEEQVREAFILGMESSSKYSPKSTFEEFIQSLKQHKQ